MLKKKQKLKIILVVKKNVGGSLAFINQLKKIDNSYSIKVYEIKNPTYLNIYKLLKILYRLHKLINQNSRTILIGVNIYCSFIIYIISLLCPQIKTISVINTDIYEEINQNYPWLIRGFIHRLVKFLLPKLNKIVFVSKSLKKHLSKIYGKGSNYLVINNGINISEIKKLSKVKLSINEAKLFTLNEPLFMYVGRFERQKDIPTLIKAFKCYLNRNNHGYLYLVGEGNEKNKLINLIKNLELIKRVKIIKWKKNVYKFLKFAKIYISTSIFEGFGRSVLEAMSLGIPIIITNTASGPIELVGKTYKAIAPCGDYKKIAELMNLIENNPTFKKKIANFLKFRAKKFSEKIMLSRYKLLFKSLFSSN